MTNFRSSSALDEANIIERDSRPADDLENSDDEDSDVEYSSSEEPEKDTTELELEKLLFGDKAGFREELRSFGQQSQNFKPPSDEQLEQEDDENTFAAVDDADLFFLDSGPTNVRDDQIAAFSTNDGDVSSSRSKEPPAWEDSDDDRMMVSLMSVPRLRKLREYEGEDVISGKEYTRRLRQQYERLHPRPEWAKWSLNSKKRRRDSDGSSEMSHSDDDMDVDDNESDFSTQPLGKLLRSTESLVQENQTLPNKRVKLRNEVIGIERMKDFAPTQPHAIISLSVHPTLPLIVSCGLASTLYLHHLRPHPPPPDTPNSLITSLQLKNTPLTTAAFSTPTASSGPKIYLSSRRRYFHTWDLPSGQIAKTTRLYGQQHTQRSFETLKPSPCGRLIAFLGTTRKGGGVINIVDSETLQWVSQIAIESRKGIADFCWWSDGAGMCIAGKGGEVNEWSVEEGRVIARWQDEGAVGTTVIALGGQTRSSGTKKASLSPKIGPDKWIAVGSSSGIVNIYDRALLFSSANMDDMSTLPTMANPSPTKALDNLTTPISHLVFSPCGQLLVMSSRWKRDALRLVHLPSCTVYKNWPTSKTPLGRVSAVAVGEFDNYDRGQEKTIVLIVGNENGAMRGWEVTG